MQNKILLFIFTVVYFFMLYFVLDLFFRNTIGIYADLLAIVCIVIAFIISVGLAEYTIKKLK